MEINEKIKKVLKRKGEDIIIDLYLKDYDRSNFYFALVFNPKIEKFKVLYVPIDAIDNYNEIEEYFCYQFIFLHTVNYILKTIDNFDTSNLNLDKCNKNLKSYYISINTYVNKKECNYTFTQFIDREFSFLFDIIVTLFEHLPNIVSELCGKLLAEFYDDNEEVRYNGSFDFNLDENSLSDLFSDKIIDNCSLGFNDIKFIENVGNRYYAFINNGLIIIDYSNYKYLLNISSKEFNALSEEVYIVLKAIKEKLEKKFYRLMVTTDSKNFEDKYNNEINFYLCYGIENNSFCLVNSVNIIELDLIKRKCVKVLNGNILLENKVREFLTCSYDKNLVEEIMEFTFVKES